MIIFLIATIYNLYLFYNKTSHAYAGPGSYPYSYSSIFTSSVSALTYFGKTYYYYFDCYHGYLVKTDGNGVFIANRYFSTICYLLRSSTSYLYLTGGTEFYILDYNMNTLQSYKSTCGTSACLQSSTGIFYDDTTNLIYTADASSSYIFIYNSTSLAQLSYISLSAYTGYPLSDIMAYNGIIYALAYTGSTTSRLWVINGKTVTATYTGLCGGGTPTYPFVMNCDGYILVIYNYDNY